MKLISAPRTVPFPYVVRSFAGDEEDEGQNLITLMKRERAAVYVAVVGRTPIRSFSPLKLTPFFGWRRGNVPLSRSGGGRNFRPRNCHFCKGLSKCPPFKSSKKTLPALPSPLLYRQALFRIGTAFRHFCDIYLVRFYSSYAQVSG